MSPSNKRILYLFQAYCNNKTTEKEEQQLFSWINENRNHELLQQHIKKLTEQDNSVQPIPAVDWEDIYQKILSKGVIQKHQSAVHAMRWLRWPAAAAVILFFGAAAYLYLNHSYTKSTASATRQKPVHINKDVPAPQTNKAVITLADGRRIQLDSINNGTLAQQGNVQIIKQPNGQITYSGISNNDLYNTLNVPRGSKVVTIMLSDGSQVWLNSESSLRYPASFSGTERKVEITGEAYFEVAHNPAIPFIVKKDALEIKVFGTRFNINTYQDEGISKITLLQGSIKVSLNNYQNLLKPGQQAQVSDNIKLVNAVDIENVMAWKNGKFQFGEKADLHLIMKKIARWYDVDVEYEGGPITQRFGGEMPMNSNLSEVLEILKTSGVKFTIDGKKVIVKS